MARVAKTSMYGKFLTLGLACSLLAATAIGAPPAWDVEFSRAIDTEIDAGLSAAGVTAAPRADDAELVRRIYLDLAGRIPTAAEARAYLDDSATDKHHTLIEKLLAGPEFPVFWRKVIHLWLNGHQPRDGRPPYYDEFLAYLQRSLETRKPWDELCRELLLPAEGAEQHGASYFLASRMNGDKLEQLDNITTSVASGMFGVQLQCAKCHDHPLVDEWKQDHYYGLAAFFTRVERNNGDKQFVLREKGDGEMKFVTVTKEERTAPAMFLDSRVLDEPRLPVGKGSAPAADSRLRKLIDHAITADNPFFKRSVANRAWKQLLGRGLVEPVDQMHSANPASHPALLSLLADDLAAHHFDLRRLLAGILHSEAYLRSSRWSAEKSAPGSRPREAWHAVALLKPLSGEQIAWSLAVATGYTVPQAKKYKEIEPAKDGSLPPAFRVRWEREIEFEQIVEKFAASGDTFQANAGQALYLTYGDPVKRFLQPTAGLIVSDLAKLEPAQIAEEAHWRVLSRPATADETRAIAEYLNSVAGPREAAVRDVVWSLLASSEFRFNH